jgi:Rho-associated protein kinase 1/Rho-associated protein kinase 2
MAHSDSPWIIKLHFAFQDEQFLYMAMDYMAGAFVCLHAAITGCDKCAIGGDLITLADNYDYLEEDWAWSVIPACLYAYLYACNP